MTFRRRPQAHIVRQSPAKHLGKCTLIVHIRRSHKHIQNLQIDEAIAQNQIVRLSPQFLCQNQKDERRLEKVRPEEPVHQAQLGIGF
jgi:hypothetical protein